MVCSAYQPGRDGHDVEDDRQTLGTAFPAAKVKMDYNAAYMRLAKYGSLEPVVRSRHCVDGTFRA